VDVEASTLLCVRGVLASAYWPGSAVRIFHCSNFSACAHWIL